MVLMAFLVKEAVESIEEKERNVFKALFQDIEKEINEDKMLQTIITMNKIDTLEKLYMFINNQSLKEKIRKVVERIGIESKNIKISLLESSKEVQERMNEIGLDATDFLFVSLAAFKNGEKIAGSVIKAMIETDVNTKGKKENEIDVYNVNPRERKYERTSVEEEIKRREKLIEEESQERKKKELEFGAPSRGNPGIDGPGL